jgi:hypothetical protein
MKQQLNVLQESSNTFNNNQQQQEPPKKRELSQKVPQKSALPNENSNENVQPAE